ncbi:c-type cytochrome [bacterium]|nr:c-type cytochrome [bacterium]
MDIPFQVPIPKDIMLDFPAPRFYLEIIIVFTFLAHILFVNLMVGGAILKLVYEIAGLTKKEYDKIAQEIASTITVNKSLAVVLGVAPLLAINVLYSVYFYSSNALTGNAWYMIVPLVTLAFVFGYIHKYTWHSMEEQKTAHILIAATEVALFLVIPFIFLSNVNLMLFPDKWPEVSGWLSTLLIPNVIPRYFHFLLACIAITGLFLAIYLGRKSFPVEERFNGVFTRPFLRKHFYSICFWATLAQFIAGPVLFFTLPDRGISWSLVLVILTGVTFAAFALWALWKELMSEDAKVGSRVWLIVALLTATVIMMAYGRHLYREEALKPHMKMMEEKTQTFMAMSRAAKWRADQGLGGLGGGEELPLGAQVFQNVCSSCHMVDRRLVGPPLTEMAEVYEGDAEGLIQWVKDPGRKRMDYPPMQAIKLTQKQYEAVAQYVFDRVEEYNTAASAPAEGVQAATGTVQSATGEVQSATGQ